MSGLTIKDMLINDGLLVNMRGSQPTWWIGDPEHPEQGYPFTNQYDDEIGVVVITQLQQTWNDHEDITDMIGWPIMGDDIVTLWVAKNHGNSINQWHAKSTLLGWAFCLLRMFFVASCPGRTGSNEDK
jgi:hypothetical protein